MNPARAARRAAAEAQDATWTPPVLRSVASKGEGVDAVLDALARHRRYLEASGQLAARRRARLRERVVEITEEKLRRRLWGDADTGAWLDAELPAVQAGERTPFAVADALIARSGALLHGAARAPLFSAAELQMLLAAPAALLSAKNAGRLHAREWTALFVQRYAAAHPEQVGGEGPGPLQSLDAVGTALRSA